MPILDIPQRVLQQASNRPPRRTGTVEVEHLGEDVEASLHDAVRVTDGVVGAPPAVQGGPKIESRIADERLRVDCQPGFTVGCENIAVVQKFTTASDR